MKKSTLFILALLAVGGFILFSYNKAQDIKEFINSTINLNSAGVGMKVLRSTLAELGHVIDINTNPISEVEKQSIINFIASKVGTIHPIYNQLITENTITPIDLIETL